MKQKGDRQSAVLELIRAQRIGSQEELKRLLVASGWHVTQATLSRDLRDLGVVRVPTGSGAKYMLPEMVLDEAKPSLDSLLPQFFSRVDGVGELIVLRTLPGGAQPIAEALDSQGWSEVLGTIAGENTILIVCRSAEARGTVTGRLRRLSRPS